MCYNCKYLIFIDVKPYCWHPEFSRFLDNSPKNNSDYLRIMSCDKFTDKEKEFKIGNGDI